MPSSARRNPWHGCFVAYAGQSGPHFGVWIGRDPAARLRSRSLDDWRLCGATARVTVVGMARFADAAA
jgi:hypothetical protein